MSNEAVYYTVEELVSREDIPAEFTLSSHLIYSSPATLAYNSPGAKGFGVKRAGLSVPDSVMLIISPGCCGRNTSELSSLPQYKNRFFYLTMSETDLVTARHLTSIPKAVSGILESLEKKPSVVMLCVTCVDALLGTDMDRVAKKCEEQCGVRVRPCYMYALTREGRKPPMVHVRSSIYSLLEKQRRHSNAVNIMGFFAKLKDSSELYDLLRNSGVRHIREISRCESFEAFQEMASASFNIVLNQEARNAADELAERLGQPYIELKRFYNAERIHRQYMAFLKAIGSSVSDEEHYKKAKEAEERFRAKNRSLRVSIGESVNADPYEIAFSLACLGVKIEEIFGVVTNEAMVWLKKLSEISPETRVYCNQDPSMLKYSPENTKVDLTIGKDAAYYHPECKHLLWNEDEQPFGFDGLIKLLDSIDETLESSSNVDAESPEFDKSNTLKLVKTGNIRGFRKVLTPFAPDQSGAVSYIYNKGGMIVIIDAGGCTGNICGFDEPRWISAGMGARTAVFSAGLRDMDAILGRDKELVAKLKSAAETIKPEFIALVGTPVPAVIATDYMALKRMSEKACGVRTITIQTNGMELYDKGIERAVKAIGIENVNAGDIVGFTPMDFADISEAEVKEAWNKSKRADILAVSPAALKAVREACEEKGLTYEYGFPLASKWLEYTPELSGKKVLIVHQQAAAHSLREEIEKKYSDVDVTVASFFMMDREFKRDADIRLKEEFDLTELTEKENYDVIFADPVMKPLVSIECEWIDMMHFAVSGQRPEGT